MRQPPSASRVLLSIAVVVSASVVGCNNGSGAPVTRLFFGSNHDGSCETWVSIVGLGAADAVLARSSNGEPDCALSTELEAAGCQADFLESNGGAELRVSIEDCIVPREVRLFSCGFTSGAALALSQNTGTQCECADSPTCYGPSCDETPALCVSPIDDPGSCEDCDNGVDDNGDGLEDCEDPTCPIFSGCSPPSTTPCSTMPTMETTSTTVTNTTDTTTTTLSSDLAPYRLLFHLDSADAPASALQWTTSYSSANGEVQGSGSAAACVSKVSGALFAPNDSDAQKEATLGLIALTPFSAPIDLAECVFIGLADPPPEPSQFVVTVEDATDGDGNTIDVAVSVSIALQ